MVKASNNYYFNLQLHAHHPFPGQNIQQTDLFFVSDLVDELIEHYDKDNDGVLDFPEFITSYKDTEKRLNL